MSEQLLPWMGEHPILAFIVIVFTFKAFNRALRTVRVAIRGWPPEHIDADGEFKSQPPPPVLPL